MGWDWIGEVGGWEGGVEVAVCGWGGVGVM